LNGVDLTGYNLSDGSEPDAVFVAEGKILHQIPDAVKSAFGELSAALRTDAAQAKN
jgi:regulator of RNase E activity RraB